MKFIDEKNIDFVFEKSPFKHVVIDNFIKDEYITSLLDDMDKLTIDKQYYVGDSIFENKKLLLIVVLIKH
jgi:hypothetical protein